MERPDRNSSIEIATENGVYTADRSGLFHYEMTSVGELSDAIKDALEGRPENTSSWFWLNGTFAPIEPEDTIETLSERWSEWRKLHQEDPGLLRVQLQEYSGK